MKQTPEELISYFLLNPDSMTQEQADAFSKWVKEKPEHGRLFVRSSLLHRGIHEYFCSMDMTSRHLLEDDMDDSSGDSQHSLEEELWQELSRQERNAPSVEVEPQEDQEVQRPVSQSVKRRERTYPKGYLWFSVVSIAATFLLFSYVWTHPRHIPQDVATVVDLYQAKLVGVDTTVQKGMRLFDNRKPMNLISGVMMIQFDNGVQVVIEGPSEFSLEEYERMRLTYGKLYAKVPGQAIGFRVNTPQCGVIDLGTEFGVNVNPLGETSVHLFKGKASLVTSSQGQIQQSQILSQSEAKRVTSSGEVRTISFQGREFVRGFDSAHGILWNGEPLSLANIASGGNGQGDTPANMGIDQKTGKLVWGHDEEWDKEKVEAYVPVQELEFVDGVFVPDGGNGPVQLTSAGHVYHEFGDTDGNYLITIGAHSTVNMYKPDTRSAYEETSIHLDGYPKETSVNLCLHANSGITFDLQKIREAMPFVNITEFTSVYGVPVTREGQTDVDVDFYVFVDGAPRMIKKAVSNQDPPEKVSVTLNKDDRFLTLVCTQGEQNFGDWSSFVNPTLKLELTD